MINTTRDKARSTSFVELTRGRDSRIDSVARSRECRPTDRSVFSKPSIDIENRERSTRIFFFFSSKTDNYLFFFNEIYISCREITFFFRRRSGAVSDWFRVAKDLWRRMFQRHRAYERNVKTATGLRSRPSRRV